LDRVCSSPETDDVGSAKSGLLRDWESRKWVPGEAHGMGWDEGMCFGRSVGR